VSFVLFTREYAKPSKTPSCSVSNTGAIPGLYTSAHCSGRPSACSVKAAQAETSAEAFAELAYTGAGSKGTEYAARDKPQRIARKVSEPVGQFKCRMEARASEASVDH